MEKAAEKPSDTAQIKVGFVSLGCPKNQIDTEIMLKHLVDAGFTITGDETEADVVIINTCAFIESAKKEAIENILDIAWLKENRNLKGIVVTGCLAERYREEIFTELPEVDALVGVGSLHEIEGAVRAASRGERFYSCLDKNLLELGGDRVLTTPPYTAYLKIAEGCDNCCTYCAIPSIRGVFRSRPIEDIVREAAELEGLGVRELNLVAQDTSRYGLDLYGKYSLAALVRKITESTTIPWIRLLYCYPDKITDELVEEFRTNDRLLKYIDLPIQHIDDRILKRMNRHGGRAVIEDAIARLRKAVPSIAIRTTAIVGFAGEGEEEFATLCRFVKKTRFTHFGAFPYSQEEGTPAAAFEDQIDEQTKLDRYDIIMQTQNAVVEENNRQAIGKRETVLVEGYDPAAEAYYGRTAADAPDIDRKIYFTADKKLAEGCFVPVRITEAVDYDLFGKADGEAF